MVCSGLQIFHPSWCGGGGTQQGTNRTATEPSLLLDTAACQRTAGWLRCRRRRHCHRRRRYPAAFCSTSSMRFCSVSESTRLCAMRRRRRHHLRVAQLWAAGGLRGRLRPAVMDGAVLQVARGGAVHMHDGESWLDHRPRIAACRTDSGGRICSALGIGSLTPGQSFPNSPSTQKHWHCLTLCDGVRPAAATGGRASRALHSHAEPLRGARHPGSPV